MTLAKEKARMQAKPVDELESSVRKTFDYPTGPLTKAKLEEFQTIGKDRVADRNLAAITFHELARDAAKLKRALGFNDK